VCFPQSHIAGREWGSLPPPPKRTLSSSLGLSRLELRPLRLICPLPVCCPHNPSSATALDCETQQLCAVHGRDSLEQRSFQKLSEFAQSWVEVAHTFHSRQLGQRSPKLGPPAAVNDGGRNSLFASAKR